MAKTYIELVMVDGQTIFYLIPENLPDTVNLILSQTRSGYTRAVKSACVYHGERWYAPGRKLMFNIKFLWDGDIEL